MRFSKAFIPTQKHSSKDATLASHKLLLRGGFIASSASGLYSYMPLGLRVLKRVAAVINEQMSAIGAQEVDLSFVTPASLWQESGRIEKFGKELLRFTDRKGNPFVLGPTHEEMMVDLIRDRVTSYKQLPLHLYQIKTKFRDEVRPRFGLMRAREFVMKDGYSFHASVEDLDREFKSVEDTYRVILNRLGLDFRVVEADSGAIGGSGSKEFMVLADSGEDTLVVCNSCEYGANIEAASRAPIKTPPPVKAKLNKFQTRGVTGVDELATLFHVDSYYILKTVAKKAVYSDGEELVLFFLRGCDDLQEMKALNATGAIDLVDIGDDELKDMGLVPGFMGPPASLDLIQCHFDESLKRSTNMICGANELDYHFVGVDLAVLGPDASFIDLVEVKEGDKCSHCESGALLYKKGIEVAHIFKLGTTYSEPLKANFLDQNGSSKAFIMGTYGMGVSRLIAAIVEQSHDELGCIWSAETTPYKINILVSNIKNSAQLELGEQIYKQLNSANISVILDDRKERFGFKMRDAELIGFEFTLIIGKELESGFVELYRRCEQSKQKIKADEVLEHILELD